MQKVSKQVKQRIAAAVICVVAAVSCVGGIGYAAGWFNTAPLAIEQASSQDSTGALSGAGAPDTAGDEAGDTGASSAAADGGAASSLAAAESGEAAVSDAEEQGALAQDDAAGVAGAGEGAEAGAATQDVAGGSSGAVASVSAGANSSGSSGGSSGASNGSGAPKAESTSASSGPANASSSQSGSSQGQVQNPTNSQETTPTQPNTISVSVNIDSSRAHAYNASWPTSLGSGTVTLQKGATVYDALCAMGVSVGGSSYYVSSIEGLAEKACGKTSGWTYSVDGVFPNYACGRYVLNGGEDIQWVYSTPDNPTISM